MQLSALQSLLQIQPQPPAEVFGVPLVVDSESGSEGSHRVVLADGFAAPVPVVGLSVVGLSVVGLSVVGLSVVGLSVGPAVADLLNGSGVLVLPADALVPAGWKIAPAAVQGFVSME